MRAYHLCILAALISLAQGRGCPCPPTSRNNDVDRCGQPAACFFCTFTLRAAPIIHNPSWAATRDAPDGAIIMFNNSCCPFSFSMTVPAPLASKLRTQFAELTGQEVGAPTLLFALHYRGCSRMMAATDRGLPSAMGWGLIGATIPH